MNAQDKLVLLLKKKGTGATMGKSLTPEELLELSKLLQHHSSNTVTISTILTAFLTLENTAAESQWIENIKQAYQTITPPSCHFLFMPHKTRFEQHIHQVIKHIDLDKDDFTFCINQVLDPRISEEHKAAFLEAERLKRESPTENKTCLDIFMTESTHIQVNTPLLIDLSVGYDGFNRTPCIWPFAAMELGRTGYPCIIHGTKEVSPKKGITPYKLLAEMDINPVMQNNEIIKRLENPDIGWAYIDQSISFPKLHALNEFRTRMVKRPILATIEKLLQPIKSTGKNIIVTGYTHPPYRQKTIDLIQHHNGFDSAVIIRGVEGSIQLATDRRSPIVSIHNNSVKEDFVRPETFACATEKMQPMPDMTSKDHVQWGLDGLSGKNPTAQKMIQYLVNVIKNEIKTTH
jgi:anthranilate phosphoribosyltransferase